jgi:hypothetical protein
VRVRSDRCHEASCARSERGVLMHFRECACVRTHALSQMIAEAKAHHPGDTRTLADEAARRPWRGGMSLSYQVRAESLRRSALESDLEGATWRDDASYASPNAWLWRDHSEGRVPDLRKP